MNPIEEAEKKVKKACDAHRMVGKADTIDFPNLHKGPMRKRFDQIIRPKLSAVDSKICTHLSFPTICVAFHAYESQNKCGIQYPYILVYRQSNPIQISHGFLISSTLRVALVSFDNEFVFEHKMTWGVSDKNFTDNWSSIDSCIPALDNLITDIAKPLVIEGEERFFSEGARKIEQRLREKTVALKILNAASAKVWR